MRAGVCACIRVGAGGGDVCVYGGGGGKIKTGWSKGTNCASSVYGTSVAAVKQGQQLQLSPFVARTQLPLSGRRTCLGN